MQALYILISVLSVLFEFHRNAYFVEGKLEVDKDLCVVSRNAISVLFPSRLSRPISRFEERRGHFGISSSNSGGSLE